MTSEMMRLSLPEPDDASPLDWFPEPAMESRGLPGVLTETSYQLPENLNLGEWLAIGETLQRMERSVMWWLGDWWRYGERRYGDMASEAAKERVREATGYAYRTLCNAAAVAKRFPADRRGARVPFGHYQDVAALPDDHAADLLAQAERHKWTKRELREMVRSTLQVAAIEDAAPPRLCGDPTTRLAVGRVFQCLSDLRAACEALLSDGALEQDEAERLAAHLEAAGAGLIGVSDRIRAANGDAGSTPQERAESRVRQGKEAALRAVNRMLGASLGAAADGRMGPMGERVYFIRSKQSGLIKIGTSRWPRRRFQEIRLATGQEVELLGTIAGSRDEEAALHERFAETRVTGEWFRESDELLSYINQHAELHAGDEPSPRRQAVGVAR